VSILARSAGVASSTFHVATSAADNTHSDTPVVLPPLSADPLGDSVGDEPALARLVERAARRDQTAFAELYDVFLGPMYRYVFYRVGSRADAEDISEQVFLQAWAGIDRFRWQGKPFAAWLYTLAHNLVVDWRRRSHPAQSIDNDEHPIDLRSTTAERALTQSLDADLLAPAIRRLTPEQQQVITLKFVAGLDTAQVATVMNKRAGTVRALQLRALQSLRRDLERQGEQGSA
jgi:RNA polymerase sigma-70 factor (ECF subfamily)